MQGAPVVRLVFAVWQFFQGAGEQVTIPVWTPRQQSGIAA
jgi:hypothetical protein